MPVQFSGEPATRWLTLPAPDRNMQLLEDFWFEDRAGRRWDAPKDSVVDGTSIPQALWAVVGSPYTGFYRRASIVHDIACDNAKTEDDRRAADRMFYEACREGGCSVEEALVLYTGVRIGAAWGVHPWFSAVPQIRTARPALDKAIEAQFQMVSERALRDLPADDAGAVEARIDEVLDAVRAMAPQ
ncbi:MAG: DUF1353 domain-containing protein [Caulobacterales bacterium]|nr:DUF1353 domain-containing protein [Caulobacterales bacterium]